MHARWKTSEIFWKTMVYVIWDTLDPGSHGLIVGMLVNLFKRDLIVLLLPKSGATSLLMQRSQSWWRFVLTTTPCWSVSPSPEGINYRGDNSNLKPVGTLMENVGRLFAKHGPAMAKGGVQCRLLEGNYKHVKLL